VRIEETVNIQGKAVQCPSHKEPAQRLP